MDRKDPSSPEDITQMLLALGRGDSSLVDRLFPAIYDQLRGLAHRQLYNDKVVTLQPTALVHEVYLRMIDQTRVDWQNRNHFFAVAARMMRRVVLDEARSVRTERRGFQWKRVEFEAEAPWSGIESPEEVLWIHQMIERLSENDPRQGQIVEMRVFGGMTVPEVAAHFGVSQRTIEAEWTLIRAWLRKESESQKP